MYHLNTSKILRRIPEFPLQFSFEEDQISRTLITRIEALVHWIIKQSPACKFLNLKKNNYHRLSNDMRLVAMIMNTLAMIQVDFMVLHSLEGQAEDPQVHFVKLIHCDTPYIIGYLNIDATVLGITEDLYLTRKIVSSIEQVQDILYYAALAKGGIHSDFASLMSKFLCHTEDNTSSLVDSNTLAIIASVPSKRAYLEGTRSFLEYATIVAHSTKKVRLPNTKDWSFIIETKEKKRYTVKLDDLAVDAQSYCYVDRYIQEKVLNDETRNIMLNDCIGHRTKS